MAENKKSFLFYNDWKEIFKALPKEKAYDLLIHILDYVDDLNPETQDVVINATFANIKIQLKRDLKKYERKRQQNRDNALKRWHATECNRMRSDAKHAVNDNDNDNVIDLDVYKDQLNLFKQQISEGEHQIWIENMYMKLRIRKGSLADLMDEFIIHLIATENIHETLKDFKQHFYNWLNSKNARGELSKYIPGQRKKGDL